MPDIENTGKPPSIIVIGGGWAGLSAAAELARHNIPVTLLESARQVGGRARRVSFGDICVDNGQHIMLGAYRHMLDLMSTLGVREDAAFIRQPLHLNIMNRSGNALSLKTFNKLPAPLPLLIGLSTAKGLSTLEKIRGLWLSLHLAINRFSLTKDISVLQFLQQHRQSPRIIRLLWEPLCIAALNTPIEYASSKIFLAVLKNTFAKRSSDADAMIPVMDLSSMLPEPAMDYVEKHGGTVQLAKRVLSLDIKDSAIQGVTLLDETIQCEHAILAVPHPICRRLLSPHHNFDSIVQNLDRIETSQITTIYLQYDKGVMLEEAFIGSVNSISQWIFDRRLCGQPGLMAVVISAAGAHTELDNEQLVKRVSGELADYFPAWPAAERSRVIREKRATFLSEVDIDDYRPGHRTPVQGVWLAGDFTNTGYPSTLEGAVMSGVGCAARLMEELQEER
ncbi:MAG: hydroxysqualene dehydroxylase HpnE [Gammaproteobacteria bacterium]|nr:MAG: hydroxysqualene dehydroxylase HpnE [Gammaproteobacteria bacterium]